MDEDRVEDKRRLASCSSLWERFDLGGAGSVAMPLRLATYCNLDNSFDGLKERGKRCETKHAGRVSIAYG